MSLQRTEIELLGYLSTGELLRLLAEETRMSPALRELLPIEVKSRLGRHAMDRLPQSEADRPFTCWRIPTETPFESEGA